MSDSASDPAADQDTGDARGTDGRIETDIAIIGGGIVGASIAYHLSERSEASVTIFERQAPLSETTFKSMALFGLYGDETQYRMKRYGMALYNEFLNDPRGSPRTHPLGRALLATTEADAEALEACHRTGADRFPKITTGMDRDMVEYIPGEAIDRSLFIPGLDTDRVAGALYRPRVYVIHPQEIGFEFLDRARENGVDVRANTRVAGVRTEADRAVGLDLEDGTVVDAESVVCAAGPWNIQLARTAGIELPVEHTLAAVLALRPETPLGYEIPYLQTTDSPFSIQTHPARSDRNVFVSYHPGDDEDSGTEYDPDRVSDTVPQDIRLDGLDHLAALFPSFADCSLVDEWVGIRSGTPDGNPIVGWTDLPGFSIAAFHTSGIQLSPAVGRIIADQLLEDRPTEHYEALSISRFDGYDDWR